MRWLRLFYLAVLGPGCVSASAAYSSFDELTYPYAHESAVYSKRARAQIATARTATTAAQTKTPLVLLHPWGTNMAIWRDVVDRLGAERRVLLVDLPGHGKSGKPPGRYPPRRLALGVLDAMEAAGIKRAIVMGNSLGGATALQVALTSPDQVEALVLISAPGGRPIPGLLGNIVRSGSKPRHLATASGETIAFGWWLVGQTTNSLMQDMVDDWLSVRSAEEWDLYAMATSSALFEVLKWHPPVETIARPTLVVHGSSDLVVWPSASRRLAKRMPNAELKELDGCGHMPEVECPDALLQVILPFFEKIDGAIK